METAEKPEVCRVLNKIEEKFMGLTGAVAGEWGASEDIASKVWRKQFDKLREETKCKRPKRIEEKYEKAWW